MLCVCRRYRARNYFHFVGPENEDTKEGGMNGNRFLGGVLIWIGGSIMVLSGMCTLGVVVASLGNVFDDLFAGYFSKVLGAALLPLAFGGIPFVIGLGFWKLGRRLSDSGIYDTVEPMPKETPVPSAQNDIEEMNKDID
jgi:hypothetical protein